MFRLARAVVCLLLAAGAAQAHITTSKVWVRIKGAGCGNLQKVSLVMDDDDLAEQWIRLTPDKNEACVWTANLGVANSFSTKLSHFSLRFDSGRTDCRKAAANETDFVAELQFPYGGPTPFRNLRVTTEPPMPVSYLRRLEKNREGGIACTEVGTFPMGNGPVLRTQFSGEDIDVQFGMLEPNRPMQGLLLNLIVGDDTLILTNNDVIRRLIAQRLSRKAWSAPTTSPNAISLDQKKLDALRFKRARIEPIK